MKKNMLLCIVSAFICILFAGCGSSEPNTSTAAAPDAEMQADNHQMAQDGGQSNETPGASLEESAGSFDAGFDVYGHYEPREELFSADLENGMVQIGNTVLRMNEATIQDFVDAGADFRDPSQNENELNDMVSDHIVGIPLYLGDNVGITCYRADNGEEKICKDIIVQSISVSFDPMLTPDNLDNLPDLYSLYFNGGVRYTGTIEDAIQSLGTPDWEDEYVNDYLGAMVGEFGYDLDDGQEKYDLSFRAIDNKIVQMAYSHIWYTPL